MINVERAVLEKFPALAQQPPLIRNTTLAALRKLSHEAEINSFIRDNEGATGFEFIDRVFEYFNFGYSVSAIDRSNIPAQGRVVIVANHPIGSLDGLALLKLVREVRPDVRIVANDLLANVQPLEHLFIPLDNMTNGGYRRSYQRVQEALNNDEAIILFPAGEVSRAKPTGIRDGVWRTGFLHFARKTNAPVLPIFVKAKNSMLFYGVSALFKPLSTALLSREMFNKRSRTIQFKVGEMIPVHTLSSANIPDRAIAKRMRKHLYKVGKGRKPIFVTEKTIAHPEDRAALEADVAASTLLGETRDDNRIVLYDSNLGKGAMLREIGRLRETAFRMVGEGTGERSDLDHYDDFYRHIVVWDQTRREVAGAYRIGEGHRLSHGRGIEALYTFELFNYSPAIQDYFAQGIELGRSFVNPKFWGKASLDYLWQGIGAYLRHNPEVRYLLGPVSVSESFPKALRDHLVYYYRTFYQGETHLARAKRPYVIDPDTQAELVQHYAGSDREQGFELLKQAFQAEGHKIPVLYKQYASLFEPGGFRLLDFSVDPDFGNCVDGLFITDLHLLKPNKRKRYLGS